MSEKPRILVLTLSFGAGHVRAAQSIVAELERQTPDAEIRLVDALENCSLWFHAFYVWTYYAMIRYAPRLWKYFFESRAARKDEFSAPVWAWRKGCRKVFTVIENFQPDLIAACEVGASEIAVIARRENLTNAEIINVITDFETEPIWVKPEISAFAVANENVKKQLQNFGADAEKIKVCGIPIDADFAVKHDVSETRERFNLDARPLILLMGGGMGPTRMNEVAAFLLQHGENLNVVALAGRDRQAKLRLGKLADAKTVKLTVLIWTNQVAALMQAATILVTKPGGLTLSEAAVCGLPVVLFDAIPGPEEENAEWFVGQGAGIKTRGSEDAASAILRLLENPQIIRQMSGRARKLTRMDASEKIAEIILTTLNSAEEARKIWVPCERLVAYLKMHAACRRLERQTAVTDRKQKNEKEEQFGKNFNGIIPGVEIK